MTPSHGCTRRVLRPFAGAVPLPVLLLASVPIAGEALTLTKGGPKAAREGDLIEYQLQVENTATASVPGVQVRDALPDAVEFVQADATPAGTFDPISGIWSLPRLGTDAGDSTAMLRLQALVRAGLLADPNHTVAAINTASIIAPKLPQPVEAQLTTNVLCGFCIDWEIAFVGLNTEHRSRLPDLRETRFLLDVQIANNGPIRSEATVEATRFEVSGGSFRPSLTLTPTLPVQVSLAAGEHRTITFTTTWAEGPFSTYTISWEFEVSDESLLDPVAPNTAAGSWTGDSSDRDDDSNCVVVVAATGSFLEPRLGSLRRFRDNTLLRLSLGQKLVGWYNAHSPPLARRLAASERLRTLARVVLTPAVYAVTAPATTCSVLIASWLIAVILVHCRRRCRLQGA